MIIALTALLPAALMTIPEFLESTAATVTCRLRPPCPLTQISQCTAGCRRRACRLQPNQNATMASAVPSTATSSCQSTIAAGTLPVAAPQLYVRVNFSFFVCKMSLCCSGDVSVQIHYHYRHHFRVNTAVAYRLWQ
jgi:hypothetical protein